MADLVDLSRAKVNSSVAKLKDPEISVLITVASELINECCNIPSTVPQRVQEACVRLVLALHEDTGKSSERLGDYAVSYNAGSLPSSVKAMLKPYFSRPNAPFVVKG